jgi:hypothetical protein
MSGPQEDLSRVIDALTAATQALTEATQVLTKISRDRTAGWGAHPAVTPPLATINTWEDDPISEATPTPNPPVSALTDQAVTAPSPNPGLSWQIAGAQPGAAQHQPGTPEFRYWVVQESLAGPVGHFVPLMPQGTRWSTTLGVDRRDGGRDGAAGQEKARRPRPGHHQALQPARDRVRRRHPHRRPGRRGLCRPGTVWRAVSRRRREASSTACCSRADAAVVVVEDRYRWLGRE